MKKSILAIAVSVVFCYQGLKAQESAQVSQKVSEQFAKDFQDATNVKWDIGKNSFTSKFLSNGEVYIAVYTREGALAATGRRINSNRTLPLKVQEGLSKEQARCEKKFGKLSTGFVFELIEQNGTSYFVPIQCKDKTMIFAISNDGSSMLRSSKPNEYPDPMPSLIASSVK